MTVNILVKHPRSGLPQTVLYKSLYLHYITFIKILVFFSIFYPAYARGVRRILQISRGLIIITFEFITWNFVPRQYFRNAPVSLFRKCLISILALPSVT